MDETRRNLLRWGGVALVGVAALSVGLKSFQNKDRITARDLNAFSRRFSAEVDRGTSLVRSLNNAAGEQSNPRFRSILASVRGEVEQGSTLSRAMSFHPDVFDESYIQEIRQGEINGNLEVSLQRLAQRSS